MSKIKELILKIKIYGFKTSFRYFVTEITRKTFFETIRNSYSQKKEDLFIDNYFGSKKNGFYVDIGANDPHRFSNTKRFYKKGWNGINIEPDPNNIKKFSDKRKRDINLNIGISESDNLLKFYQFIPNSLSTFSKEEAHEYIKQGFKIKSDINIKVRSLSSVLSEYYKGKSIDFFSIDTEGFDMQVLRGNDWNVFRPTLICIESVRHTIENSHKEKLDDHETFLNDVGYVKIYDNELNSIYENRL